MAARDRGGQIDGEGGSGIAGGEVKLEQSKR